MLIRHEIPIALLLPEDGPRIDEIRAMARRMGVDIDTFISQAVIDHHERLVAEFGAVPRHVRDRGGRHGGAGDPSQDQD